MLERDMLLNTLDLLKVGIVLTNASARIVHANHAALALLADGAALCRTGVRLSARDRRTADNLARAIAEAATSGADTIPGPGIEVPIPGRDGRDLAAWVLPLNGRTSDEVSACVAVFVRELGDTSHFPAELFRRRFGATPAECRVLMLLSQGMTATAAAASLGVSRSTVKSHLESLFGKTGTRRQGELLRLATSAVAPACT